MDVLSIFSRNLCRSVALVITAVALSSCAPVTKKDRPVLDRVASAKAVRNKSESISERLIARVRAYYVEGQRNAYDGIASDPIAIRNAVVNDLLIVSDESEKLWRIQMKDVINSRQIMLDISALLLSTAGTVVPHASIAKIFSGGSTAVQGANSAWDKRYIAEQTIDVVINAVAAERLKKKAEILTSLKTTTLTDYGVSDGVRDAVEYDGLLSLQVGISAIQQGTSEKLTAAKAEVAAAKPKQN